RQMPVGVVEPLEVVDVEEEQREGAAMAKTANHLLFQVLDEVTAVVGPRQHVRDGEAAKLLQVGGLHVALAQQFVDDLPDLEAVAHFDPCRLVDWEAPAVEPGAVGRPQVEDANLATLDADGAVAPGNAFDAEDDRTGIAAAEDGLALGEKDARADARPLGLQQEDLGLLPSGRRLDHLGDPGFVMHASNLPPRLLVAGAGDLEGEKFVDRKSLYLQPGAKQANGNSNAIPLAHLDGGKRNRELQDASESPRPHHAIFHAKLDLSLRSGPPLEFERPAPRTHLDGDPLEGHLADGRLDARVEAKEEMAFVETKVHSGEGPVGAVHRLPESWYVQPGAEPFPVGGAVAVDARAHEPGGLARDEGLPEIDPLRDERLERCGGWFVAQRAKCRLHVMPEKEVEFRPRLGGEVLAVPPEPVRGLGPKQMPARGGEHILGAPLLRGLLDRFLRLPDEVPGGDVLGMADPDAEAPLDPGAGVDAIEVTDRSAPV